MVRLAKYDSEWVHFIAATIKSLFWLCILSKITVMQLTFVFPCNAAYLREGIQGLPNWEQQSGGRRVCSGGKRGGEASSRASLTQVFGSRAKKRSGHTTGELPQRGSVLRSCHAQCQTHSQPAQHPSAGLGPQVSLCSGLQLRLAAAFIFLPYCIFFSLILPYLF